jgi:hypothetical protein
MNKVLTLIFLLAIIFAPTRIAAQDAPAPPDALQRIRQLETQIEALRGELENMRQALTPKPAEKAAAPAPQKPEKPEAKPVGIDLGPVRVTPYGTVYLNFFGNSSGNNNEDVPLFATPGGVGSLGGSARQTRLGLKFTGPKIGGAQSGGALEADFSGGFPAIPIGENFGVVRLRLANARLDWEKTSLVVGQEWAPFAPVNPFSLASAGIPSLATSGNLWTRSPQVRLERRWRKGRILWQGAVLSPASGDFPAGANAPALLQPGAGAASKTPYLQSRVSFNSKNWLGLKKAGSVGFSGQYGRGRVVGQPVEVETTGLALDWSFPLARRVTLAGEAFFGRGLAGFQGGVFQGVTPDFAFARGASLVAGGARAVGARGGWAQVGWTPPAWQDRLTVYAMFGQDDPRDEDLVNLARRDVRTRNQTYGFSSFYKLSPQLMWGAEWRRTITTHSNSGRQTNNHLNLSAAYNF